MLNALNEIVYIRKYHKKIIPDSRKVKEQTLNTDNIEVLEGSAFTIFSQGSCS